MMYEHTLLDESADNKRNKRIYKRDQFTAKAIRNDKLGIHYKDVTIIRIKNVMPVKYDYLTDVDINNPTEEGRCVDEFLIHMLCNKENRKPLSEKGVKKTLKAIRDEYCIPDNEGLSIQEIGLFCDKYKISHYAFDARKSLVFKKITKSCTYTPLVYYCVDSHLYPILDKKAKTSIIKSHANRPVQNIQVFRS